MISHNDIKGSSGGVNSSLFNLWPPAIGSGHDRGEIYMVIYGGGDQSKSSQEKQINIGGSSPEQQGHVSDIETSSC